MARPQPQAKKAQSQLAKQEQPVVPEPAMADRIAKRAYELFLARGGEHGHQLEDWYQAERELRLGRN
jgi:hypothetical protein